MTGLAIATQSATAANTIVNRFITTLRGKKGVLGVLGTSRPGPPLEIGIVKSRGDRARATCHDAHNVRRHLKKAPRHRQPGFPPRLADIHDSLPQKGHEPGGAGENPY